MVKNMSAIHMNAWLDIEEESKSWTSLGYLDACDFRYDDSDYEIEIAENRK